MKLKSNSPVWAKIEAILLGTDINICKMQFTTYQALSKPEQKKELKALFEKSMVQAEVNLQTSFTCMIDGHEDTSPSMRYNKARQGFHCFGCMESGINYDVFDFLSVLYSCKSFVDSNKIAEKLFISDSDSTKTPSTIIQSSALKITQAMRRVTYNQYYYKIEDDEIGLAYLRKRGITRKTAVDNALMTWQLNGHWYIVCINDNGSVTRRKFAEDKEITGMYSNIPPKWLNTKEGIGFFNFRCIEDAKLNNKAVFVVESAFNALSLTELAYPCVAINGAKNLNAFLESANYSYLIGLLDNDKVGTEATKIMTDKGFYCIDYSRFSHLASYKDVNEALVANRDATACDIAAVYNDAFDFYRRRGESI